MAQLSTSKFLTTKSTITFMGMAFTTMKQVTRLSVDRYVAILVEHLMLTNYSNNFIMALHGCICTYKMPF